MDEIRLRRFSASRISELLAKGKGKSKLKYIYDLGAEALGFRRDLNTKEMKHGIANQFDAFEIFRKYKGDCEWWDSSMPYGECLVATPDILADDFVADVKCQFSILNFHKQNETLPRKYWLQSQTQMLCAEKELGYIINYLSKPDVYNEEWKEYEFEENERLFIHKIDRDESILKIIIAEAEANYPLIFQAEEMLGGATIIDEKDFFYYGKDFEELRDLNWTLNKKEVFRFLNKFFVKK
jgi:hypothetical protein